MICREAQPPVYVIVAPQFPERSCVVYDRMDARVRRPLFEGGRCTLHERDSFDHGGGHPEDWDQIAVFDPEAGLWRFVPRDVVTGGVN